MSPKVGAFCLFLFALGALSQIVGQLLALRLLGTRPVPQPSPDRDDRGGYLRTESCPFCPGAVAFYTKAAGHLPPACEVWSASTLAEFSDLTARLLVGRATTRDGRA